MQLGALMVALMRVGAVLLTVMRVGAILLTVARIGGLMVVVWGMRGGTVWWLVVGRVVGMRVWMGVPPGVFVVGPVVVHAMAIVVGVCRGGA